MISPTEDPYSQEIMWSALQGVPIYIAARPEKWVTILT